MSGVLQPSENRVGKLSITRGCLEVVDQNVGIERYALKSAQFSGEPG